MATFQATSNGSNKPKPRFELDNASDAAAVTALANLDDKDAGLVVGEMMMAAEASEEGGKRRPSYMPTRGLAAMLNQGLAAGCQVRLFQDGLFAGAAVASVGGH